MSNNTYAEPVSDTACSECGHPAGEFGNIGIWESGFTPSGPDRTLCLACAMQSPPDIPAVEETLFEPAAGGGLTFHAGEHEASLDVETPFGAFHIDYDINTEQREWHDPGGGVNSAGAPRRSQEWTEKTRESSGTVHLHEPKEVRSITTTKYFNSYVDNQLDR